MKLINFVVCCLAATITAVMFSGCYYGRQTEQILNIPVEAYNLTYQTEEKTIEVVAAKSSMRVYYFERGNDGYEMNSRDLIGKDLYSDGKQDPLVDNIRYIFSDNSLTVNEVTVNQNELDYIQFKSYCLEYFGDTEDMHFKEDIFNLVQACLSESKINKISGGILDDHNLCKAEIKWVNLIGNTLYTDIIKKRLNNEQFIFFTNKMSELSVTTQKTVVFEILTDVNYEIIYPVIEVWRQGVSWFNIDMFQFI